MAIADDGSVILGGLTNSSDFALIKLDADGNFEWQWTVSRRHRPALSMIDGWAADKTPHTSFLITGQWITSRYLRLPGCRLGSSTLPVDQVVESNLISTAAIPTWLVRVSTSSEWYIS